MDWTQHILSHYRSLRYSPPLGCFTVLSALYLVKNDTDECKIISIATGTKCLPVTKYSKAGDVVHDFHAEVVARRAAVRWFLSEIAKPSSEWLERSTDLSQTQGRNSTLGLRPGVKLHMYISELPCGAASMNTLAYLQTVRDPEMASLKSKSDLYISPDGVARGRNGYELSDVVRTKPGE
ncbi:hypothetical protein FRC14_007368 [Serendipita sp. 396]|nr:hypothetical protein FRC14_007368 [Serendipita sp. 396]KAG8786580.1 hypothetical protein FRC15_011128 [Serendipita sp. 397]